MGELDELETFVGWIGNAADHFKPGILFCAVVAHNAVAYKSVWDVVQTSHRYFYVTDAWKVYQQFMPDGDQIISKTYML